MTRITNLALAVSALAAAVALPTTTGVAQQRVEAGILECQIAPGIGLIVASQKALTCTFNGGGRRESYTGTMTKVGLDIGFTGPGFVAWAVLAPTTGFGPGALAGTYGGVSAQATAVVGVSANALIGGSNRTFVLQPVSVGAQVGLNLAIGVTSLELRPG